MMVPRKAILLAAGFGTRMRPLSCDLPKPAMPLWGKPAAVHMLERLRDWGVREVLVNLHHAPGEVIACLRGVEGVRVCFSFEHEILGTGGALRRAAWFLDDRPFWIANTDIAADVACAPFLRAMQRHDALAALWLHPERGPRTVEVDGGLITGFRSTRAGAEGTSTFCGVQIVNPRLLDFLPETGFSTVVAGYEEAMRAGERIAGVIVPRSYWSDLGDPESYLATHAEVRRCAGEGAPGGVLMDPGAERAMRRLRRAGVMIAGFAAVGEGVNLERGAVLRDAVVWDGARVGPCARVERGVVGRDAVVLGSVAGAAIDAAHLCGEPALDTVLALLHWPAHGTLVAPLGARGSDRVFTRLSRGRRSVIAIHCGDRRPENFRYAAHARFLGDNGVPVPRIVGHDPARRVTVLEDWGDRSLQEEVAEAVGPAAVVRLYRRVLDAVLALHAISPAAQRAAGVKLERPFSPRLFRWERELMLHHLLVDRLHESRAICDGIMADLACIAEQLRGVPRVLVHRDLQSSNVLLRGRRLALIDFQGMRWGPAAYDLASLLCDPYVMLPEDVQEELLDYYVSRAPGGAAVRATFWAAAVQRLAQALGAYARLGALPGTGHFARHIPPALRMMSRALQHLDALPHLRRFAHGRVAHGRVTPSMAGSHLYYLL